MREFQSDGLSVRIPADVHSPEGFHGFLGLNGPEGDVTYFCFIESSILSVPHMEPLAAEDPDTAEREAEALLEQHSSGYAAHVFADGRKVVTVRRDRGARASESRPATAAGPEFESNNAQRRSG